MTDLDLNHLRSWIGRTETAADQLTSSLVQRLNATLDRDGEAHDGATAPLLIHHCLCLPAVPTVGLGPDGHPERGGFLPPVPLPRRMWAGSDITFHAPLWVGDEVRRQSEVTDVAIKEGRSGRLCFVAVKHAFSTAAGPAVTETQNIVYRDAAKASKITPPAPQAQIGEHKRSFGTEPERLFRYSALTFNTHRIHYDAPYTTNTEGYPGLVVHGPLQAMVLAHFAADLKGAPLRRFRFRGVSPMIAGAPMDLHASEMDDGMKLWTARGAAPTAMEAQAWW